MNAQDSQHDRVPHTIEPTAYTPTGTTQAETGAGLRRLWVLVPALLAVLVLGFLFSARSVTFAGAESRVTAKSDALLPITLGGVHLLLPGSYTVTATADGYFDYEGPVEISGGRNQVVELPFEPLPGLLSLNSQPEGAEVLLLGTPIGTTPLVDAEVRPGPAVITVTKPRYQTAELSLNVEGRQKRQQASVVLEPDWAEVTLTSEPAGASILIDGEATGVVTPGVVEALSGEREFAVALENHQTVRQRLFVTAQQAEAIGPLLLKRADRELVFESQPSGVGITLNGAYQGETPLTLALDSQTIYRLRGYKAGYRDYSQTLRLAALDEDRVSIRLTRETGTLIVRTQPANAVVKVNDRPVPNADDGVRELTLPTGRQKVSVTLDGYAAYTTVLSPKAGLTQELRVKLLTVEEARRAALKPTLETAAGQRLVLVEPQGALTLGASRREPGRRANEVLREAALKRLFYLSEAEVTNAEFQAFSANHDSGSFEDQALNKPEQPVSSVSWIDAALYCNWLSKRDSLQPFYRIELGKLTGVNNASTGYRLPTEAEWRYAANQVAAEDEPLRFPWGARLPPPDRFGNYADRSASNLVGRIIFGYNDNYIAAAPVKSYKPNLLNLYDLSGNVAEWAHDFYGIPDGSTATDPLGPESGEYHVIKGSSWMHGTVVDLRLAYRDYGLDGRRDVGFRLARYAE
ncbi:MAG: PEGA domain-containing protein, partial [Pseudomonadota bacterium]